jgi:hypothetical protein
MTGRINTGMTLPAERKIVLRVGEHREPTRLHQF